MAASWSHESIVTIRRSAFTGNQAVPVEGQGGSGGGVHMRRGQLTVENSTFSGNQAEQGGGLSSDNATIGLQNVTMIANGANGEGGGIHSASGNVSLANTILARNGAPLGANCLGRLTSGGHNLLGDLDSCTVLGQTSSNVLVQSQEWSPLARTFADTYAYDLSLTSRAVDAGSCVLSEDQRGVARPAGKGCDIDAVEYDPAAGLDESVFLPLAMR